MALRQAEALAALKSEVAAYAGCGLKQTATHMVFADGVVGAPLVVIGEAPGAAEDAVGKPFVGRSGKLLDAMLAQAGYSRSTNTYITNAVFWRPPHNRPPTPPEIASCRPFLLRHLALAQPKALLLVGATAAKAVLQTTAPMASLRGRWLAFAGAAQAIPTLVTFHPAYVLRNPAARTEVLADLALLAEQLGEPHHHVAKHPVIDPVAKAR